jgi:short-subunit dehydrogenase involved in D-alanine esterification of teichoic acids
MAIVEITNSKILIVGGSSGMGLALAKRSLAAGAEVIIVGRNEGKLKRIGEELQNPAALHTIAVDITQEGQVADLFERIGRLDHIVSTAANIEGAYELLPSLDLRAAQRESKFYGPQLLAVASRAVATRFQR